MPKCVLCFGELLLRLGAPHRELLLQSPQFTVHVGGAEANVAIALAAFGHAVGMACTVADNALGRHAAGELRRHGVDTTRLVHAPGRMGLYFLETGALQRPSEVLYDRADSAFARARSTSYDWPALLDGVDLLHLSGVTPALGAACAQAAIDAARCARERGVTVVFDGNYRGKLWQAWNGDAPALLAELFACANVAFADHRDVAIVLGRAFDGDDADNAAADAAFAAFPGLATIASTRRVQHSVDRHELSAQLFTRDAVHRTHAVMLEQIVDRIGGGDAFAAGVLHGRLSDWNDADSLAFGLAAGCLKHAVPGDYLALDAARVQALVGEARYDVRR